MKDQPEKHEIDERIRSKDFTQFEAGDSPKALAKQQRFIQDAIYSRPFESAIRETVCNAVDAHLTASTQKAVKLRVEDSPRLEEKAIVVQDYGTGMSQDTLDGVFPVYHHSTKDENNRTIGGYGNGAKVPFAHADRFLVKTVKDGLKNVRIATKHEEGDRFYKVVTNSRTDEPNGTEVHIPLKDKSPIHVFNVAADSMYYMPLMMPLDVENRTLFDPDSIGKGDEYFGSFITRLPHYDTGPKEICYHLHPNSRKSIPKHHSVSVGGVQYQVPKDVVRFNKFGLPHRLTVMLPIGSVDLDGARENLQVTEKTIETLETALSDVAEDAFDQFYSSSVRIAEALPPVKRFFRVKKLDRLRKHGGSNLNNVDSRPKKKFSDTISLDALMDFDVYVPSKPFEDWLKVEKVRRSSKHSGGYKTTRYKANEQRIRKLIKIKEAAYFGDANNSAQVNATLFEKHDTSTLYRLVAFPGQATHSGHKKMLDDFQSGNPLPLYSSVEPDESIDIPEADEDNRVLYYEVVPDSMNRRMEHPHEMRESGDENTVVYGHQKDVTSLREVSVAANSIGEGENYTAVRIAKSRVGQVPSNWTYVGDSNVLSRLAHQIAQSKQKRPKVYKAEKLGKAFGHVNIARDMALVKRHLGNDSCDLPSSKHRMSKIEKAIHEKVEAASDNISIPPKVEEAISRLETVHEAMSPLYFYDYSSPDASKLRLGRLYLQSDHCPYQYSE